jgi:hypothetical protein
MTGAIATTAPFTSPKRPSGWAIAQATNSSTVIRPGGWSSALASRDPSTGEGQTARPAEEDYGGLTPQALVAPAVRPETMYLRTA